jgi:tetratricopeptide (TPR) repeat protein
MAMIHELPDQLAGAAALKLLEPSWVPVQMPQEIPAEEGPPVYLLRAREAVAAYPHNALAYARLAQAAQAGNEMEEAIEAARRGLDLGLDQRQPAAVHATLLVLAASGHGADLVRLLDDRRCEFLPLGLRLRAAVLAKEHRAALSILSDQPGAGECTADGLSLLTWVHLERGEFEQAITVGRRAQARGAVGAVLYSNLGYAHAALGHLEKAIKLTRQAAALAPEHRGVGFNLARYLMLEGDMKGALAVLERLRPSERVDIQLALAMSGVMEGSGETEEARRLLQRVRASQEWALADTRHRAELVANLALLRMRTGRADSQSTLSAIRCALAECDYESLSIGYLLSNLLVRLEQGGLLANVIDRLQSRHGPSGLHGMRMQLALLEHNGAAAVTFAKAWMEHEVLNPIACALATLLVSDVEGDFEQAARIGLGGLRRAPANMALINNTSYALAFAGDAAQAKQLLRRLGQQSRDRVEVVATGALVELLMGRVEEGLAGYRRAWQMARAADDEPLADLVAANAALACHHAGLTPCPTGIASNGVDLDATILGRLALAARSRPGPWLVSQRLRRELGVDLLSSHESGGRSLRLSIPDDQAHNFPLALPSKALPQRKPRGLLPPPKD